MSLLPRHSLQSLKMAAMFGGIIGLGLGCVISLEPIEPCESGVNNKLDDNGECECRIGYEWCDPNDSTNLNCCDEDNAEGGTGPGDGDGDSGDSTDSGGTTGSLPADMNSEASCACSAQRGAGPAGVALGLLVLGLIGPWRRRDRVSSV